MPGPYRIFIVEDEMAIALMIEDMIGDLGHQVAGIAMRLPQALDMVKDLNVDLAILDINLDGRRSFPVARMLRDKGVKVLFASGYGAPGLEAPFLDEVIIKKPFEAADLKRAIEKVKA